MFNAADDKSFVTVVPERAKRSELSVPEGTDQAAGKMHTGEEDTTPNNDTHNDEAADEESYKVVDKSEVEGVMHKQPAHACNLPDPSLIIEGK